LYGPKIIPSGYEIAGIAAANNPDFKRKSEREIPSFSVLFSLGLSFLLIQIANLRMSSISRKELNDSLVKRFIMTNPKRKFEKYVGKEFLNPKNKISDSTDIPRNPKNIDFNICLNNFE